MKALMLLQEEQEDYIQTTQREQQELRQEMENKSRSLDEAQKQLSRGTLYSLIRYVQSHSEF